MIAYLKGQPLIQNGKLIVITGGVGYGVMVGPRLLANLASLTEVELFLHTYVREDRLELYGFKQASELQLFEQVLSVSGVGPKMALALVDAGASAFVTAVQQADLSFFTSVPRVGKKLGQKIIIELKTKLGGLTELSLEPLSEAANDLVAALISLGYPEPQAEKLAQEIPVATLGLEAAIKQALKKLH